MSSICGGFVQNAWRKDICSNCFRLREEHGGLQGRRRDLNEMTRAGWSDDNDDVNKGVTGTKHSISIVVKNGEEKSKTRRGQFGGSEPHSRYQSPTTGIPRASLSKSNGSSAYATPGRSFCSFGSQKLSTFSEDFETTDSYGNRDWSDEMFRGGDDEGRNAATIVSVNGGRKGVRGETSSSFSATSSSLSSCTLTCSDISAETVNEGVAEALGAGYARTSPPLGNNNSTRELRNGQANCGSNTQSAPYNLSNGEVSERKGGRSEQKETETQASSSVRVSLVSSSSGESGGSHKSGTSGESVSGYSARTVFPTLISVESRNGDFTSAATTTPSVNDKNKEDYVREVKSVKIIADAVDISIASDMYAVNGVEHVSNISTTVGSSTSLTKYKTTTTSSIATGKRSCRGILKAMDGRNGRKLSVKFRQEVCEVIGYGGPDGDSDDEQVEDEDVPDPQDNVSLSELLANNANTTDEKTLHQLTIKNTNFNSIKTNLMGYAPIEIGPIVGCTGGKSMENSSKPLVSIGTFEGRKEPLRIRKIITKDDDVLNDSDEDDDKRNVVSKRPAVIVGKTVKINSNRNDTGSSGGTSGNAPSFAMRLSSSRASEGGPVEAGIKTTSGQTGGKKDEGNVVSVVNISSGSSPPSKIALKPVFGGKSDKSGSDVNTILRSSNAGQGAADIVKVVGKSVKVEGRNSEIVSNILVSQDKSSIIVKAEDVGGRSANGVLGEKKQVVGVLSGAPACKPKPILKNKGSSGIVKGAGPDLARNKKDNHLVILNGGSIASKRSSFLQEIIAPESGSGTTPESEVTVLTNHLNTFNSNLMRNYSEEPLSMLLDSDSLEISAVQPPASLAKVVKSSGEFKKLDLKLSSCKGFDIEDHPSEFDDSLEDSGLDIGNHPRDDDPSGTRIENLSESDDNEMIEKGSNSDSGNENDFPERLMDGRDNLFISVDEDGKDLGGLESVTKPKLSPDSVLFSSASETSNTGSAESIPECVNVQIVATTVKRPAPLPPQPLQRMEKQICDVESALEKMEMKRKSDSSPTDLYDDIGLYRNNHYSNEHLEDEDGGNEVHKMEDEEREEESLYDDCTAVASSSSKNSPNKSNAGSYDFTNGARSTLDTDFGLDGVDSIPLRPSDGIEFIGIRKIDSETHLNECVNNSRPRRSESPETTGQKDRSSSVSPKPRRKAVNQFFSTIGKRAGAAFAASSSPLSGAANFMRQKSPSPAPTTTISNYRRSLSQDEVSMTRTQEIYATLTPASLKFKGLSPVLQKLSKMDNDGSSGKDDGSKEKMFKKNKLFSIKKFLRMGSKDVDLSCDGVDHSPRSGESSRSYDFKTESPRQIFRQTSASPAPSSQSSTNLSSIEGAYKHTNSPSPTKPNYSPVNANSTNASANASSGSNHHPSGAHTVSERRQAPLGRPPPPPPRVHSLDLLNKVGSSHGGSTQNIHGTVKPARPPPPVRSNRIAPSFVSVFATEDDMVPPCKPKRKASMNGHSASGTVGRSNDMTLDLSLESNVTSLNFETLRLIAGQDSAKIRRKSSNLVKFGSSPLRWSHFYVSDPEPMADGNGYAFYSALWEDEPCVLFLQEDVEDNQRIYYPCVEVAASFLDYVPGGLVPWSGLEYSKAGQDVQVCISVLPSCTVKTITNYIGSALHPVKQKHFALLASLAYWGREDVADLLVFQGGSKDEEAPSDSELVYVLPAYNRESDTRRKRLSMSLSQSSNDFEICMKQFLVQPHVLSQDDRQVLFRLLSGTPCEVEAQLKLFLQVKLFSSRLKQEDFEKLQRTRSERVLCQWLEKERALCMKDAIERTLQRQTSEAISPLRKAYVEFLMISDARAKPLLELLLEITLNNC